MIHSRRTLYVGNLDLQVTEELVMAMFGQMGTVRSCKIIREPANINAEPYGFVEFADHSAAAVCILCLSRATGYASNHYKISQKPSYHHQSMTD